MESQKTISYTLNDNDLRRIMVWYFLQGGNIWQTLRMYSRVFFCLSVLFAYSHKGAQSNADGMLVLTILMTFIVVQGVFTVSKIYMGIGNWKKTHFLDCSDKGMHWEDKMGNESMLPWGSFKSVSRDAGYIIFNEKSKPFNCSIPPIPEYALDKETSQYILSFVKNAPSSLRSVCGILLGIAAIFILFIVFFTLKYLTSLQTVH